LNHSRMVGCSSWKSGRSAGTEKQNWNMSRLKKESRDGRSADKYKKMEDYK